LSVTVSENAGFCFGVKRTLALATSMFEKCGFIYSFGEIIHNPQEVERLKEKIIPIYNLDEIDNLEHSVPILIRSHGVSPETISELENKQIYVVDATCPFVKKAQEWALAMVQEGYQVVVVGDAHHPEVEAIAGWAQYKAWVVENPQQAAGLPLVDKMGVLSQTTQTPENFLAVVEVLRQKASELKIHNTICEATIQRQQAALKLAETVDFMIVVGGKNSSNTKKLASICSSAGVQTIQIETASELNTPQLHSLFQHVLNVGVTAGASTPDWIIEEVVTKMTELEKMNEEENLNDVQVVTEEIQEPVSAEGNDEKKQEELELSFDQNEHYEMKEIRRGSRVKGVIVQIKKDELLIDIGSKSEGVLPASELINDEAANIFDKFHIGDEIEVLVLRKENKEGYPVLSKKRIDQEIIWDKLFQAKAEATILEGKVIEVVKGGLLLDVGIRGFVPASLVSLGFVEDLSTYIGKIIQVQIIECDKQSNKLVLSAKNVLKDEALKNKEKVWSKIAVGQTIKGVVRRLTNFGAFVDIGGVDGLLHVSEMAWYRVNRPSDLLKEGDEIDVYVLAVDPENNKISLGLKQLVANPWSIAVEKYSVDAIYEAKVMRIAPFGAFVQLEPGVEGLVHISQLAHHRVEKTEDVVKPGDMIQVKVLSVDPQAKRMSLSLKATVEPPVTETTIETPIEEKVKQEESAIEEATAQPEESAAQAENNTLQEEAAVQDQAIEKEDAKTE